MRVGAVIFCCALSGCAQPPPPEIVSPPAQVVVVEKPVIVEKRVVIERPVPAPPPKPLIIEKRVVVVRPALKKPGKSPCAGLLELACKKPACTWVKHTKLVDKGGRALRDYCRISGKA
tara:strand:- start:2877 stop:3230 length:354 start_codon:yes stop_codon:yes gene_type:complete